ncbi:carbohydrate ABC transporter ATP-binding protein (CUT1 family) [Roseiarcus fermentans]|uniref:Carbohydrate ABC transporter ATP-binding protein (CUT1 family) n=1 Tax=Roseiarcus fermentans TaxID=1473586 RepID=A0A366FVE7_9HYPH|nr:ABC transporter ATP-binding protein [Roseiarcus fermentans]RBP18126.1 carbohydrate ABC transporter ATP-binding protein (CUT1 family) [Roseiarcus fermentans]
MARLEVDAVTKIFGASVRAVDGLSFAVADREFVFLLGPSGAGKTTTLRMIAGLEQPSDGRVLIDGRDMTWAAPRDRNVAMVYDRNSLYPHLSAYENMAYPLRLRRTPGAELDARVKRVAEILRIGELLDRAPRQLSGGQQQRVAIGRMLVRDAGLYLMDEPISHLDAKLRSHMRLEFKKLQSEFAATILYVSHDQLEAMTMADRIIVVDHGAIQQIGAPREIFQRPANRFVAGFVGEPAMNFLACEVRADGGKIAAAGDGFSLPLCAEHAAALSAVARTPKAFEIGLRPQHLAIAGNGAEDGDERESGIGGTIYAVETLGSATVFDVSVGQTVIRVQANQDALPNRAFRINDPVRIRVDTRRLHLFDRESGRAAIHPSLSRESGRLAVLGA